MMWSEPDGQCVSGCFRLLDDADEELDHVSKDSSAKAELTSDVTLLLSDNDDNVTVRRRPHCRGPVNESVLHLDC